MKMDEINRVIGRHLGFAGKCYPGGHSECRWCKAPHFLEVTGACPGPKYTEDRDLLAAAELDVYDNGYQFQINLTYRYREQKWEAAAYVNGGCISIRRGWIYGRADTETEARAIVLAKIIVEQEKS